VQAVLAVASPVTGDQVTLTNQLQPFRSGAAPVFGLAVAGGQRLCHTHSRFRISARTTSCKSAAAHGQRRADVIAPAPDWRQRIRAVGGGGAMIAGEGGHVTMAPATPQESALLDLMRSRFDHVSAERALSGPGLVNLYNALCELSGTPAASYSAEQITNESVWNADPRTQAATSLFCAMLGTVAGNLALTLGARGGIFISGGIVPRISAFFAQSEFPPLGQGSAERIRGGRSDLCHHRPLPVLFPGAALIAARC
jgi:glucokinase